MSLRHCDNFPPLIAQLPSRRVPGAPFLTRYKLVPPVHSAGSNFRTASDKQIVFFNYIGWRFTVTLPDGK